MQTNQTRTNQLLLFKVRNKFSTKAWDERGLIPSSAEVCQMLSKHFDVCADRMITAINEQRSEQEIKKLLKSLLAQINKHDFDTEEKEFICDLYYELSMIAGVDLKEELNKWLYGSFVNTLMKMTRTFKTERIVETRQQPCSSCGNTLETYIIGKEQGIPDSDWFIIKCNHCNELNLLSPGPNIKQIKFGNYQLVETLRKEEYTEEQAAIRLEQIKLFRKPF